MAKGIRSVENTVRLVKIIVNFEELKKKVNWVWCQTLLLHRRVPETRLASSLSDIEIFVILFYSGLMKYDPKDPLSPDRDRLIISKGHGAVSMYPVLADTGFFEMSELELIAREESFLGVIPDTSIPGFETINGSLGHGLGVACGIALGLKKNQMDNKVFVLCGDGEMNCGAIWEAVMFASFHRLDNIILLIDDNKLSMLGYQKDILGLEPLERKFSAFDWNICVVDGHDLVKLYEGLNSLLHQKGDRPSVAIVHTKKGCGVPRLETDDLCHIRSLTGAEIDDLLSGKK